MKYSRITFVGNTISRRQRLRAVDKGRQSTTLLFTNFSKILLIMVIDGSRWLWMGSLQKNIQLILEFVKDPFLVLHFSYYTLMTYLMMLSKILLYMLMILLYTLNVISYLSVATTRIGLWTWIGSTRNCRLGQEVASWFQCRKNSTRFVWPV